MAIFKFFHFSFFSRLVFCYDLYVCFNFTGNFCLNSCSLEVSFKTDPLTTCYGVVFKLFWFRNRWTTKISHTYLEQTSGYFYPRSLRSRREKEQIWTFCRGAKNVHLVANEFLRLMRFWRCKVTRILGSCSVQLVTFLLNELETFHCYFERFPSYRVNINVYLVFYWQN